MKQEPDSGLADCVHHPYLELSLIRPKKDNCLVVLHNFIGVGAGGQIFFFKSKSNLHKIIASISQ